MNNNGIEASVGISGELISLGIDSVYEGTTAEYTTVQREDTHPVLDNGNSLLQMTIDEQDLTKPYRIIFRGELVHD